MLVLGYIVEHINFRGFMPLLKKLLLIFLASLMTILCLSSLILFIVFIDASYLNKTTLREGVFDITGKSFVFDIENMGNRNYDLQMACYRPNQAIIGYESFLERITWKDTYLSADVELTDSVGAIVKKEKLAPNRENKIRVTGFYREGFDFQLFNFDTKRGEKYKLRITFNNEEEILDKISKHIFMIKHHDSASMPWIVGFQVVFCVIFVVSSAVLWRIWIYWKRVRPM